MDQCERIRSVFLHPMESYDLAEAARRHTGSSLPRGWLDARMAALGWQRTFGDWPANVMPVKVVDTCDMCGKAIHESELSAFATTERMREMRADGLIDADPVRPSRERDGADGYVQCQPCLARTLARAHRTEAPSSRSE